MDQCIFETMRDFYFYTLRIRLTEQEKSRLLGLMLSAFEPEDATKILEITEEIKDWDYPRLTDEYFRDEQYRSGSGLRRDVLRAKSEAIVMNNRSCALPSIESRAPLVNPETLGARYDKALLDYARGRSEEAENAFNALLHKNFCIEAGYCLARIYMQKGEPEKLAACLGETAGILRECLMLDPPEWMVRMAQSAGIHSCLEAATESEGVKKYRNYVPFDPLAPASEKERFGFA